MSSVFPAILIGGDPHRGKSVFSYILSGLLRERETAYYLLRATPDGEGNWYHEASAKELRNKRTWNKAFEQAVGKTLQQRPLPFLVDVGGKPTPEQQDLFGHCTHSIILGKDEKEWARWRDICERQQLQPLAEIRSVLEGDDAIICEEPILRLQLTELDREKKRNVKLAVLESPWHRLAKQVAQTIGYQQSEMWQHHQSALHFDALPVNLDQYLKRYAPTSSRWQTSMLPQLLADIPQDEALAIYGRAPTWIYSALALHSQKPFYCFNAQYGWLKPPTLQYAVDESAWKVCISIKNSITNLDLTLEATHLTPLETLKGPLPLIPGCTTILLSGQLPIWLYIALARHYQQYNHPIAIADPRIGMPDDPELKAAVQLNGPEIGKHIPWKRIPAKKAWEG